MQKDKNFKKKKSGKGNQGPPGKCKIPSGNAETTADCKKDADKCHSDESRVNGEELMNQFKETAEKLKLQIKDKLDSVCSGETKENVPQAPTAANDTMRVRDLLEKAMADEESVKCPSKSVSPGVINVTLDESQESTSNVPRILPESPGVNEVNHCDNGSSETEAKETEKVITHVQESPNGVPVSTTDEKEVKIKDNQSTSSELSKVLSKAKQTSSNASVLASIFDKNKQRTLPPKLTCGEIVASVASCTSDGEKVEKLAQRLAESGDHQRKMEVQMRNQEKMITQLIKEKERLQVEFNRTLSGRNRLENVCRELQRQNRSVKEEALSKIKEEEDKRREVASKFQGTLNEVLSLVQANQERNEQLRVENVDLLNKLKAIMSHYELWEASVQKLIHQKDIEVKLSSAKMAHTTALAEREREHSTAERDKLYSKIVELQEKAILMDTTESHLREELSAYTCKYEEFQKILGKSNETFSQFKKDMEKMSKQMKKLEKETLNWKGKFEACNRELSNVTLEKQAHEKELKIAVGKIETLQKLCRALQARNSMDVSVVDSSGDQCGTCDSSHS